MLEAAPFSRAFAVQLVQRLREQDPAVTPTLDWLDRRLTRETTTADELVHVEHQEQIANHATVRNVITSMRLLSQADWADFFESVSLVHEELCDGTRVDGDGLSDAGPLPACRRRARAGKRERRAGGGPAGRPHGGRRARRTRSPASATPATT